MTSAVGILGRNGWETFDPSTFRLAWNEYIPIVPTPQQLAFLLLECEEAFFGGAAGPGKSVGLLAAALQYVDEPDYAAILFRKSITDLTLPGALMDVAQEWLQNTDAVWHDKSKTWSFPPGATLTFGYLDGPNDKYRYQSSEFQFVGFDEVTQHRNLDYTYLFSRLRRSAGSNIPIRMRSASNPGGVGHDWVKERFITQGIDAGRVFIPGRMEDNPHLDQVAYLRVLANLDPITRAQLRDGDWSARAGGNKFQREWFEIVDVAPAECRKLRFWDMAATVPKPGKDPDWTVGTLLGVTPQNVLYVLDVRRVRKSPGMTEALVKQTAELDGKSVPVRMEQEGGSSGVTVIHDYATRVLMGWEFKGIPATGSKEVRANPVASQAEASNIKLVRHPWNEAFLSEVELFPTGSHDDQVDSLSGALSELVGVQGKPFMVG